MRRSAKSVSRELIKKKIALPHAIKHKKNKLYICYRKTIKKVYKDLLRAERKVAKVAETRKKSALAISAEWKTRMPLHHIYAK